MDEAEWLDKFKELQEFMMKNQRRPQRFAKEAIESYLSKWEIEQLKTFHQEGVLVAKQQGLFTKWHQWIHESQFKHLYIRQNQPYKVLFYFFESNGLKK